MSSSNIFKFTEGVVSRVTDFTLLLISFEAEILNARNYGDILRAGDKITSEDGTISYQSIKRSLLELKRKGLIKTLKSSLKEPQITALGRARISSLLPGYIKIRPWDKNLYLVSYDVPVSQNYERNLLREYLKKIGCGILQESIWVTPYNPSIIIREFVGVNKLSGTVLVSLLGKDGSIGGMGFEELIEKVYKLSYLNDRYTIFIAKCKNMKHNKIELISLYWSFLKDDPQLPFELLPDWWVGDKAYAYYKKLSPKK